MRICAAYILPVLILCAIGVHAQEPDTHNGDLDKLEEFRSLMEQEARDLSIRNPKDSDIIELVERIMTVRLARRLGLTIEETKDLGNAVGDFRDKVYDLKWLRAEKRQSLRHAVEVGDTEAAERELNKLLRLDRAIAHLIQKMIEDSQEHLTVEQAADFYLFIEDFESDISETIEQAQRIHHSQKPEKETGEAERN